MLPAGKRAVTEDLMITVSLTNDTIAIRNRIHVGAKYTITTFSMQCHL